MNLLRHRPALGESVERTTFGGLPDALGEGVVLKIEDLKNGDSDLCG